MILYIDNFHWSSVLWSNSNVLKRWLGVRGGNATVLRISVSARLFPSVWVWEIT